MICVFFEAVWRELIENFFTHSVLLLRGLYACVCVCVGVRWTRLNYPLLLYSPLILIISGDLLWKAYRCRTGCSPQRLYSIIDTVLKFSQETHIFSASWCFLINYYKALSSNIWVRPKCYPVRLECSVFRKKHCLRWPNFWRIIFLMDWLGWKASYIIFFLV